MSRSSAPAWVLAALCPLAAVFVPAIFAPAFSFNLLGGTALAAPPPPPPPSVGVTGVRQRAVTSSSEYIGRIQAIDSVALIPRVTAYLEKRLFNEGAEVKKGDLLYVLEQGPFQAAVLAQQGTLAQAQATVINARVNFQRQAQLLRTPAGQQQAYDNAQATAQSGAGNVLTAQGNLQSAQIQLAYTEIRAPVDGRITSTSVNEGNVVSQAGGPLATIVTQDPMYVVFPAATRDLLTLQKKYQTTGGLSQAAIKLTLSDGSRYDQNAHLDYVSPTVSTNTDTITLRATVANPQRGQTGSGGLTTRELVNGEFVTVTVQDPHPVEHLTIPRSAVLSDQEGDYVFTLDGQNVAKRTNLQLGETVGSDAVVLSGLALGQKVIVDGIQKVHDGAKVSPSAPQPVVPDPDAAEDEGVGGDQGAAKPAGNPGDAAASKTGSAETDSTSGGQGMQAGAQPGVAPDGSQAAKNQAAGVHGSPTPPISASPSQR